VLPLETHKPANLPFALLEWGRGYIKDVNECVRSHPAADEQPAPDKEKKKRRGKRRGRAKGSAATCNSLFPSFSYHLIQHVYYTESDQILHFSDPSTRRAILSATNASTFLIGRRMEKVLDRLPPASYMSLLAPTRALCGDPKDVFLLDWPTSTFIQKAV
jgi:hypothetical protein